MKRQILTVVAILGLLLAFLLISEARYQRDISPDGMTSARDYVDRFGEPPHIQTVQRDGKSYYQFNGPWPRGYLIVLRSAPPAYIFDEQGQFVDFCGDPGDAPSHGKTWPVQSADPVEFETLKQKWGL